MAYLGAGITRFNTADELTVTGDAKIDTNTLVVDSTNNRVGILNASPATALDVTGTVTADDIILSDADAPSITLTDTTNTLTTLIQSGNSTAIIGTTTDHDLRILTNNTERMRIDSSGNVGIGETAPANLLHVKASDTGITPHASAQIVLEREGTNYLQFLTAETGTSGILFGDGSDVDVGGIKYDHNTTAMQFVTEAAERMRIDSSGNVGIGTSSPDGRADIAQDQNTTKFTSPHLALTATNTTNTTGFTGISYASSSLTNYGWTVGSLRSTSGNNASFVFNVHNNSASGTERMRIDGSGNLLVGTTGDVFNSSSNSGIVAYPQGSITAARSSAPSAYFNRQNTDGSIIDFRKDGSSVGTIGTYSSRIYIGTGDTGLGFSAGSDNVFPITAATGAIRDAAIDLGLTTGRFRDLQLSRNCMASNFVAANDSDTFIAMTGSNIQRYFTGGSEKARLDATGNFLIGCTSLPDGSADGIGLRADSGERRFSRSGTSARYQIQFYNGNGAVGRIETSGTSTSYVTSSDYRLKENVTDISDGITRLKQLQPRRFNFIADAETTVDGFIAHEAATVVPEAVTGTKDAVMDEEYEVKAAVTDDDGAIVEEAEMGTRSVPNMQGIDQSKIVPLLTAALQEAIAKIETLETKVAALEAE